MFRPTAGTTKPLRRNADLAMNRAKAAGKGGLDFFHARPGPGRPRSACRWSSACATQSAPVSFAAPCSGGHPQRCHYRLLRPWRAGWMQKACACGPVPAAGLQAAAPGRHSAAGRGRPDPEPAAARRHVWHSDQMQHQRLARTGHRYRLHVAADAAPPPGRPSASSSSSPGSHWPLTPARWRPMCLPMLTPGRGACFH